MQATAGEAGCDWSAFRRNALRFSALFILLWLGFGAAYVRFPYVRNGASIIYSTKFDYVSNHAVFDSGRRYRIAVLGDSRALAAFRPDDFDRRFADGSVQSFNLALPGERDLLPILRNFLASGNRPTHVLITTALPDWPAPTLLSTLRDDRAINRFLFPFQALPRDLALFVAGAIGGRGLVGQYVYGAEQAAGMIRDRGWYFIAGQSHYPNDRLPADYALPSDRPTVVALRPVHPGGRLFRELAALAQAHDFRVLLVPNVLRRGRFAPARAPSSDGPEPIAGSDRVERIGPDYLLLPAPQFSDSTHLNRHGARQYSQYLARLLQATLR